MKKLIIICIIILFSSIFLTSCSTTNSINLKNDSLANYIKDLSADSMQGRLVGTDGNRKAASYVEAIYTELGLSTYTSGSFLQGYKHKVLEFDKSDFISISNESGKQINFIYGKDYLEASVVPGNFICPIIKDKSSNNLKDSFILISNENEIGNIIGKAKGVLIKSETLKKYTGNDKEKGAPLIQVNDKMFDYLYNNNNLSITYNCKYVASEIDAYNVIGLISGSKHEKALILSAHFDHVGVIDNNIYNGAVDNSSGISVLLDIANKLQQKNKANSLRL